MVCQDHIIFKGCFPQILLDPFLNTSPKWCYLSSNEKLEIASCAENNTLLHKKPGIIKNCHQRNKYTFLRFDRTKTEFLLIGFYLIFCSKLLFNCTRLVLHNHKWFRLLVTAVLQKTFCVIVGQNNVIYDYKDQIKL